MNKIKLSEGLSRIKAKTKMSLELGRIVMTPGIQALLYEQEDQSLAVIQDLLRRHKSGDWGDVSPDDKSLNDAALNDGDRVLSAYTVNGVKVWCITEADRSVTTFLLPDEY